MVESGVTTLDAGSGLPGKSHMHLEKISRKRRRFVIITLVFLEQNPYTPWCFFLLNIWKYYRANVLQLSIYCVLLHSGIQNFQNIFCLDKTGQGPVLMSHNDIGLSDILRYR